MLPTAKSNNHMKTITFLRPFTATRAIKGKFRLATPTGGIAQGFAFRTWSHQFRSGEVATVSTIKGDVLVVTNDAATGEVVLAGAREGVDFEIISELALAA